MVDGVKRKKKKRGGVNRKMTAEQTLAYKSVAEWVYLDTNNESETTSSSSDFGVVQQKRKCVGGGEKLVFDLHSHSKFSDGFLTPTKLVERAHANGVKVLSLTDHDTMDGIPEAIAVARRVGIKIIPGVEISTISRPSNPKLEEPVHILAYYSSCGPTKYEELEKCLSNIRDGRILRAKDMILKLNKLKVPLKWEHVARIAGKGTAPGRLHIARALHEAGYVVDLKQAFTKYLYDGGPAYSTGSEPLMEDTVRLICETGGISVLAHPWALKNPINVIRKLKEAGLHGMEVYRSDGRHVVYSDLADTHGLLKIGGSDYHAKGGHNESELGSVNLPVTVLQDFLNVARPIWCRAIKHNLRSYVEDPTDTNLAIFTRFGKNRILKGISSLKSGIDLMDRCLSLWLTNEEREDAEFESIRLKLAEVPIDLSAEAVVLTGDNMFTSMRETRCSLARDCEAHMAENQVIISRFS
ncbi:hypothetical protein ACFE04_023325 [Oxalis oulophora]